MSLVEAPRPDDGDPHEVRLLQDAPQRVDCSLQGKEGEEEGQGGGGQAGGWVMGKRKSDRSFPHQASLRGGGYD